ncbi:MAG TPA: extracellular solute-binding protein [Planctomycetota bacterium]|nr:extracellular solute-binding protein [Planctomycetota bacterium]
MAKTLKVALVGGPMYDGLYARLPQFEKASGIRVEIGFRGDHPSLNQHIAEHGRDYDVISTHSKYAPSQAQLLRALDDLLSGAELASFTPSTIELMRYRGALLQLPRLVDAKIVLYRRDLFEDESIRKYFEQTSGRALEVPKTWDALVEVAGYMHQDDEHAGFVFPGKESGLFGHFFEILESAGGTLFDDDLKPAFESDAGRYALETLIKLYKDAAPKALVDWHYDQVAAHFQAGKAAMTTDWPGGYHGYQNSRAIRDLFDVAIYPVGPSGKRRVYAGAHSFAITTSTTDVPAALELLRFLTSEESQIDDARRGSVVARPKAMEAVRAETKPGSREERRLKILEQTMRDCMAIPPKFPTYPPCEDALWGSIRSALLGRLSLDEALKGAAAAVRKAASETPHPQPVSHKGRGA